MRRFWLLGSLGADLKETGENVQAKLQSCCLPNCKHYTVGSTVVCGYLSQHTPGLAAGGCSGNLWLCPRLPMQPPREDVFQLPECCACCIQLEKTRVPVLAKPV